MIVYRKENLETDENKGEAPIAENQIEDVTMITVVVERKFFIKDSL